MTKTAAPEVTETVLADIRIERERQEAKFGQQNCPLGFSRNEDNGDLEFMFRKSMEKALEEGRHTWKHILLEEVYELINTSGRDDSYTEAVQVAAVAAAIAESILRKP